MTLTLVLQSCGSKTVNCWVNFLVHWKWQQTVRIVTPTCFSSTLFPCRLQNTDQYAFFPESFARVTWTWDQNFNLSDQTMMFCRLLYWETWGWKELRLKTSQRCWKSTTSFVHWLISLARAGIMMSWGRQRYHFTSTSSRKFRTEPFQWTTSVLCAFPPILLSGPIAYPGRQRTDHENQLCLDQTAVCCEHRVWQRSG